MTKVPSIRTITGSAINSKESGSGGLRKAENATVTNQISLLREDTASRLTISERKSAKITKGV